MNDSHLNKPKFTTHLIRASMVLLPGIPIAFLYSQAPFCWWKVIAYCVLTYVIAVGISLVTKIKSHKLYCLIVLISILFIGTAITIVQDWFIQFPPNLSLWELLGLSLLCLAGCVVVFAIIFWLYWKLDIWICRKLEQKQAHFNQDRL